MEEINKLVRGKAEKIVYNNTKELYMKHYNSIKCRCVLLKTSFYY